MNNDRYSSILVAVLLGILPLPALGQGVLIWSDEFDGTVIDPANWEHQIGDGTAYGVPAGWGNNELQYYTARPENSFVADGKLHIIAREESYAGYDYTSARLRTLNKQEFLYGRLEARMQLPTGQGLWPAFWMLPSDWVYGGWAASGEIDIMESVNIAETIYGTIHYGGEWPAQVFSGGTFADGTDYSTGFHVFALEWQADTFRWYVDDVPYHLEISAGWYSTGSPSNQRAPFDQFFHFLLNIAVGGNFPGPPDGTASFPQEMIIDWVRVYNLDDGQWPFLGTPHSIPGQIEAEDFDAGNDGVAYHDCDSVNHGGAYRTTSGVDIEPSSEGGFNVGWLCENEWLEYSVDVQAAGTYRLEARVASLATGGNFHVEFDAVNVSGDIPVPATGGWQTWTTVSATMELAAGTQIMRFVYDGTSDEYNVSHFTFSMLDPADLDRDGDVDLDDFALFADCLAGPGDPTPPAGCAPAMFVDADLDFDNDVDLADFSCFQMAFAP